jgi:WD40-like Beta Propeller Repeat
MGFARRSQTRLAAVYGRVVSIEFCHASLSRCLPQWIWFMKARLLKRHFALLLFALCWTASTWCAPFQLVSKRSSGDAPAGGSGDSWGAIISPDGRFVLFASAANNLVVMTNGHALPIVGAPRVNVFVRDRTNNTTTLVSANLAGTGGGNGDSIPTALSTNGQFACFESSASDLTPNDTNGVADVFVRDLLSNTTMLVSMATNGGVGNGLCRGSVMTPDGHFVAFVSAANSLVANDSNNIPDVFVRDLQSKVTTLVSVGALSTNSQPLSSSESPEITPDGRYVAFYSSATNLVAGANHGGEVYVRDLIAGTTICASTNSGAILGTSAFSYNHAISSDGQYVAYQSSSNAPLAMQPTQRAGYILRFNTANGTTDIVNTNAFVPPQPAQEINNLAMSPDGRFIAFVGNTNGTDGTTSAIFRWDALSGTTFLASADLSGNIPSNSVCDSPHMDSSGRYVAFLSSAPSLVTNLLTGDYHLYLRDMVASVTTLLDADTNSIASSVSPATVPRLNDVGGFVAFESPDANLVANDRNHDYDLFIRDVSNVTNELISARNPAMPSASPNGASIIYPHAISADGERIAFSSEADNLIENDTNAFRDVFVRDLLLGTNILVSASTNGLPGDNLSFEPALSANGRYVAFTSSADNLVPNDANRSSDVFVRDLATATTVLVSVNNSGTGSGNRSSRMPMIGADGRYVAFWSFATDLAPVSITLGISGNLFLRDTLSNLTYALTTNGAGNAVMTPDGRFILFYEYNANKIYVWDSKIGARIFTNTIAATATTPLAISDDGNRIAYSSGSTLVLIDRVAHTAGQVGPAYLASHVGLRFTPGGGERLVYAASSNLNGRSNQVYVIDFQSGTNHLVSQSLSSGPGSASSDSPDISADGRFVAYRSFASDLVSLSETNGYPQLYLYDSLANSNSLLTASLYQPGLADNRSATPFFNGNGHKLIFASVASDLLGGDFNHSADVFALGFLYASITAGLPGFGPTITWPARPGETYHVQFKSALTDAVWQEVSGVITFTGDLAQLTDLAPSDSQRFYRIAAN